METADRGTASDASSTLVDEPVPAKKRRRWPRVLAVLIVVLPLIAAAAAAADTRADDYQLRSQHARLLRWPGISSGSNAMKIVKAGAPVRR